MCAGTFGCRVPSSVTAGTAPLVAAVSVAGVLGAGLVYGTGAGIFVWQGGSCPAVPHAVNGRPHHPAAARCGTYPCGAVSKVTGVDAKPLRAQNPMTRLLPEHTVTCARSTPPFSLRPDCELPAQTLADPFAGDRQAAHTCSPAT